MILGITGGSGCGKTTLLELIRDRGGLALDCDQIYHRLLETDPGLVEAIGTRFPGTVENGVLLRKDLARLVFSQPQALESLNAITHRAVKAEVVRQLDTSPVLAAIDAIGLFEGGLAPLCTVTVAVTAPESLQVARLMARDGLSRQDALARIRAQHDSQWFRERCDHVLENTGSPGQFREKCLAFLSLQGIIGDME